PEFSRSLIKSRLVDRKQLAVPEHPAPIDHHRAHRYSVLAVDELIDDVVEGRKMVSVGRKQHKVGEAPRLDGADALSETHGVRAATRGCPEDCRRLRPIAIVALVAVVNDS